MKSILGYARIFLLRQKFFRRATGLVLAAGIVFFSMMTTALAVISPIISPVLVAAGSGKTAQDVGGIVYTNDQAPTISATFDANGGPAIDAATAVLRINGVPNPSVTTRDAAHISYTPSSNLAPAAYAITVNVKNTAATAALKAAKSIVVDTTAPSAPVISAPLNGTYNNPAPAVIGIAEANAGVKIYDGITQIATTTADGSGNFSVAASALSSGDHALTANATDYAGNVSVASDTVAYTVDITPPAVPVLTDEPNSGSQRPTLEWGSVSGASEYRIQIDNDADFASTLINEVVPTNSFTSSIDLPLGALYWQVASRDIYGNESSYSSPDSFIVDIANPTISSIVLSDPSPVKAGILTVTVNFSEAMKTSVVPAVTFGSTTPYADQTVSGDFTSGTQWQGTAVISGVTGDGSKTLKVVGYQDEAGNPGADDVSNTFNVDTSGPNVNISTPVAGQILTGATADITWSAADAGSGITPSSIDLAYSTDGMAYSDIATGQANSGLYTWTLPAIESTSVMLRVKASDNADNPGQAVSAAFTIDRVGPAAPTGSITPSSPTTDNTPTVTGTVDSQAASVLVSVGSNTLAVTPVSGNYAATFGALADGNYLITVQAFDVHDNASAVTTVFGAYVIDIAAPAFTAGSASPSNGTTTDNAMAAISGTFLDNGSGLDTASIRFAVNSIDITTGITWAGGTFTYTPTTPSNDGSYTVEVDLADNAGNRSDLVGWVFAISSAPTITSISATGGRVVSGYVNDTNTGFSLSGTLPADGAGIQTLRLHLNGVQLASTLVLMGITAYSIDLSGAEFSQLKATDGGKSLSVDRVGFSGNVSVMSSAASLTVDTVAPAAPGSNILVQQNAPGANDTITGAVGAGTATAAGAYIYDGASPATLIGSASINPNGSFGPVLIGDNLYDNPIVAFRDEAGNESAKVGGFFNQIIAPTAPAISSPIGFLQSIDDTPMLTGSITDTGVTVKIYKDGAEVGSGPVDEFGNFSITTSSLGADNSYGLTAKAIDSAQNVSADSAATTYILDRLAPAVSAVVLTDTANSNSTAYTKNGGLVVLTATVTDANQTGMTTADIAADLSGLGGSASANPANYNTATGVATWANITVSGTTSSSVSVDITAVDRAGNNGSGFGSIVADNTAPIGLTVTDDGIYVNSLSELHAAWSASDSESGIASYSYAIGTTVGGSDIKMKTNNGGTVLVTATGLTLVEGATYYFTVYAANGAGIESNASSDGIVPDVSDPTAPGSVADDGDFTQSLTQLQADWMAGSDLGSGVDHYEMAVGTTLGGTEILGFINIGNTSPYTKTGLTLASNTTYYISIKTVDHVGRSSAAVTADGIMADNIAPSEVFHAPGAITNIGASLVTVVWADTGSDFAANPTRTLDFGTGINVDTTWSAGIMTYDPGVDFEEGSYTVNAAVADRAGNIGTATFTFTVDTIAPVLTQTVAVPTPTNNTIPDYAFNSDEAGTITYGGDCSSVVTTAVTGSNTASFNTLGEGAHTNCTIQVTDAAGNNSLILSLPAFTIDTTAPTVNADLNGIAAYGWSKVSGSGMPVFGSGSSEDTTIWADQDGLYTIRLSVTDSAGNIASDEMSLTWDTTAPTVNAGPDRVANASITQDGLAGDTLSGIAAYQWTKESGPDPVTIGMPNAATTTISTVTDNIYTIRLAVTDNAGNSAFDEMALTKDTVVPAAPTVAATGPINNTNKTNIMVSGTGEANASLSYILSDLNPTHDTTGIGMVASGGAFSVSGVNVSGLDDGTVVVAVTLTDAAGNIGSAGSTTVDKDTLLPTLSDVTIASNNTDNTLAKMGDTVTVSLTSSEDITVPTVTIAGNAAPVATVDAAHYTASYQMASGDTEGAVAFVINFSDLAGNTGTTVIAVTSGSDVIFDKTVPIVNVNNLKTNDTTPALSGTIDDNGAGVAVTVNSTTYPALISAGTWTLPDNTVAILAEGSYAVLVSAIDSAGNAGGGSGTLVVDTTNPVTMAIVSPATPDGTNGWYKDNAPTVALPAIDISAGVGQTYYHLDSNPDAVYGSVITMPEGTHILYFHSVDQAGNIETEQSITIKTDTHNPGNTVSVVANSGNALTSDKQINVVWSAATDATSGVDHYLLRVRTGTSGSSYVGGLVDINLGNVTSYTLTPVQAGLLSEGTYSFGVRAVDAAGNIDSTSTYSGGVTVDLSAPAGGLISLNNGTIYTASANVNLTLAATDTFAPVLMMVSNNADLSADGANTDSGNWIALAATKTWILSAGDGAKTVYARFKDAGNNETTIISDVIILDTAAPAAPVINPISGYQGNSVNISGTAEADSSMGLTLTNGATITVSLVADGSGNWSTTVDISALADGTINVNATVSDQAGNTGGTASTTLVKDTAGPSFSSILANPLYARIGTVETITFTASETLQANPIVIVGGNPATFTSNSGLDYSYTYTVSSGEGVQTILISGTDLAGNPGSSTGTLINDFTVPTINSGTPTGNISNALPTIQATVSDAGGSGVSTSTVIMRINGVAVNASYNVSTGVVSYVPSRALSARSYAVTVDAKDSAGNAASRHSFTFSVVP